MSDLRLGLDEVRSAVGPDVDLGEDLGVPDPGDGQALVADEPGPLELHRVRLGREREPVTRTRRSSSGSYTPSVTSSVPDGSRIVFGLAFS